MFLTREKQDLLNRITKDLQQQDGVSAIVLGGSYAMGNATEKSDLDIGIYYSETNPFDIEHIKSIAKKYAIDEEPTVVGFYEWGAWVNGGAWINTVSGKVDFIYRNIEQVKATIEKSKKGVWENDFDQQPPYGFSSIMYLAEIHYCLPLYDPQKIIGELKAALQVYPKKLKEAVIQQSLWSAEFTIAHAVYFSKKDDLYNTMGCLTRALKNIATALFAINEVYPIGDKRAVDILEKADRSPAKLKAKIEEILHADQSGTTNNILCLKKLFKETVALADGHYKTPFKFSKD